MGPFKIKKHSKEDFIVKRWLFLIFIASFLAMSLLAGCGGGNSGGGNDGGTTYTPGQSVTCTIAGVSFNIHYVPNCTSFPTGTGDSGIGSVSAAYWMAETEVTYQLWSTVYTWANTHGYTFDYPGGCGGYYNSSTDTSGTYDPGSGHETDPVTTINWRDAIVWCNALTEYYNAESGTSSGCVYKSGNDPIRNTNDTTNCDEVVPDESAKGFRLPTSMEWELAARWRTDSTNTVSGYANPYFTKGNSASGAVGDSTNAEATKAVAWYWDNSNYPDSNINSTQPVGGKTANALGIKDMSGNVWEWCFDKIGSTRMDRGGGWDGGADYLQVGNNMFYPTLTVVGSNLGFRFVRTQ